MQIGGREPVALEQIKAALEQIPPSQKQAYCEAQQKAPYLFEKESHPIKFIESCDYNVWDAAEKLVNYWEDRKRLFRDRAFFPMTQAENGALTPEDVIVLQAGFPVLIEDTGNGKIMFFDRRKALAQSSREARLRCVMYLLTAASEDIKTRAEQLHVMVLLVTPRVTDFDQEYAKQCVTMFNSSPCKIVMHRLECLPKAGKRTLLEEVLSVGIGIMSSFNGDIQVHREVGPGHVQTELQQLGFSLAGIPTNVGGLWKFESFTKWCKDRAAKEGGQLNGQPSSSSTTAAKAESKQSKKRLLGVIHSRQKRERRRQEQCSLLAEKHSLLVERERLQREQLHLEGLLEKAKSLAQMTDCLHGPLQQQRQENQHMGGKVAIHATQPPQQFPDLQARNSPLLQGQQQYLQDHNFGQARPAAASAPVQADASNGGSLTGLAASVLSMPKEEQKALLSMLAMPLDQQETLRSVLTSPQQEPGPSTIRESPSLGAAQMPVHSSSPLLGSTSPTNLPRNPFPNSNQSIGGRESELARLTAAIQRSANGSSVGGGQGGTSQFNQQHAVPSAQELAVLARLGLTAQGSAYSNLMPLAGTNQQRAPISSNAVTNPLLMNPMGVAAAHNASSALQGNQHQQQHQPAGDTTSSFPAHRHQTAASAPTAAMPMQAIQWAQQQQQQQQLRNNMGLSLLANNNNNNNGNVMFPHLNPGSQLQQLQQQQQQQQLALRPHHGNQAPTPAAMMPHQVDPRVMSQLFAGQQQQQQPPF